ncbi:MAG: hypothetical protein ACREMO_00145 [Gemmatimonadales bacterium]
MTAPWLPRVALVGLGVAAPVLGIRWLATPLVPTLVVESRLPGGASGASQAEGRAEPHLERVVARDPFRMRRVPSPVAYDPIRIEAGPPPPSPPKPALSLSGIVAGEEPSAIIEGLPGTDGPRVLRPGERVAGIVVRRIEADRVVLEGFDTTWTLKVKEPWK